MYSRSRRKNQNSLLKEKSESDNLKVLSTFPHYTYDKFELSSEELEDKYMLVFIVYTFQYCIHDEFESSSEKLED